ncbi:MAG: hypothetical protein L0K67_13820, partial [Brevibacterium sp.]|nr:hypothetical protein [Brevibacterium sp.]
GLDEFGEAMPVDYNHTRIYFAAAEDMAGAERVGSLTQPGSWNSGSMAPDVPVWVAVSAVDHVGNESAMTPAQSVTPRKLVDDDSIRDAVEGIDDKINNAVDDLNQAIDNIVVDANGTTTYWMPTVPDETTDPKPKIGDLWFDTSEEGKNELHRFDGDEWVSAADERIDTIRQAQDDLEADVDRVRTSVDGKNAVIQSTSTPPNQYDGTKGDIWEIMSSMGSGGRSVSRWRWNGTVWVSNLIGDTVLGNVDAAKIGPGYLSADRIDSHSLTADKLLVGGSENAIADDDFVTEGSPHWVAYSAAPSGPMTWSAGKGAMRVGPDDGLGKVYYGGDGILPCEEGERWKLRFQKVRFSPVDEIEYKGNIKFLDEAGEYVSWHGRTHFTGDSNKSWCEIESVVPEGAAQMVLYWRMHTNGGWLGFTRPTLTRMVGATLIEDGAITTDKIATGAITAESGIIGSINAGTITVGEMDGARIKARTIAADKVLIGSQANAIADDEFFNTAGSPHWDLYQSYTDEPMSWSAGKPTIKASAGAGLSTARYGNDGILPCEPGEHWRLRFQKIRYSPVDEVEYNVNIEFLDAAGNDVSWHGRTHFTGELNQTWCEIESIVPEGASQMHLYWRMETAGGDLGFTRPTLSRVVGATLIQNGAITTDKILANAITAGKIAA